MKRRTALLLAAVAPAAAGGQAAAQKPKNWRTAPLGYSDTPVLPGQQWKVHDIARPRPSVVTPGRGAGDPPSDAVVLFNGTNLAAWGQYGRGADRNKLLPAKWKVENGYTECVPKSGDLVTREKFGDAQIHIEWASPLEIDGDSQWRGNSGILIMGRYEIQVLDSWDNPTYADGQAGAIYGQWPPLVNPIRRPGEWNSFNIYWEAPRFDGGRLVKPAYVTVVFNGVLVHHHKEVTGPMAHRAVRQYEPHGAEEPLSLQDHETKPRFRNMWIRRLKPYDSK